MTFIAAAAKMAAEEGPKPRVNGSMLPKHTGQIVSVVAKYLGQEGSNSLKLETSDGQELRAKIHQPLHEPPTPFVEVIGRVNYDCSLAVEKIISYGAEFDLGVYDEAVKLAHQFPKYFMQDKPAGQF